MPFFNYVLNLPNPPNTPSQDVNSMQANTNAVNNIINADHFAFNNNNGGFHKQVHLFNQGPPGLAGADGDLFANAVAGQSLPFWENGAGGSPFQIALINGNAAPVAANPGRTFLPGGIIVIWDKITIGLNVNNLTVTFAFGGFTNCFNVFLSAANDDNSTIRMALDSTFGVGGISATQFRTQQTQSGHLKALYYVAIGN